MLGHATRFQEREYFPKYSAVNSNKPSGWCSMVKGIAIGKGSLGFEFWSGQFGHTFVNGSPVRRCFLGAVLPTKVRQTCHEYPDEFSTTLAGDLRCDLCDVLVKCNKKFFVESHRKSKQHQGKFNQSSFLFLKKKKKVPSNTSIERETQEKEETTQRQSVETCDMKIVVHTHTQKKKKKTRATPMVVTPKKNKKLK